MASLERSVELYVYALLVMRHHPALGVAQQDEFSDGGPRQGL
jgi:hypothetical protein